ncbi:two-component response regulator [Nostoc sp. NIES-2111]|jgi:DNA-binding NarL/FixJ family response regulator|nr:two-component response regulator [Nostoc sp. NIES-2111]
MKFLIKALTWIQGDSNDDIKQIIKTNEYDNLTIAINNQKQQFLSTVKQFTTMDNGMVSADKLIVNQDLLTNSSTLNILVIDDHQLILGGTMKVLEEQYPQATIAKAGTASEAIAQINSANFDLIVMDLSIPQQAGMLAQIENGINLLQYLLKRYPQQNFLVQSSYVKALVRIKHEIDEHEGGFAIADKGLSESEMLIRVSLALQGATHTKDIKTALELKPEWLEVLKLAFEKGLTDRQIAIQMHRAERSVRTYWTKIQDVLGVYPEEGKNMRIQTEIRARQEGLID